ncbi:C-type lectin domain family 9 member A-like isoform X2 [Mus pahari]|uniref:C-type lectin domain family 9 member A-like isoform X2 n=1 Tax=Mus pahari TaxID=10093 RepID=UPI000A305957|nr:C-type lectin domain family 9 member A-like isoform X2 [Mus pahari]
MNEERLTYADLKLSLKSKKDRKQSTQKKREYPWRISVVILGTVCLCLLISITVLGYLFFQAASKFKIQCEKDANESAVTSMEVVGSSGSLLTTGKGCWTCQGGWSCCGEKCYYFSEEEKTWDKSEESCRVLGSHLAKIDSREEQNFIQAQLNYSYWVGLRKKGGQFRWVHHKDAKLSSDLDFQTTHVADAECGYIKPKNLNIAQCNRYFYYICMKNFICLRT